MSIRSVNSNSGIYSQFLFGNSSDLSSALGSNNMPNSNNVSNPYDTSEQNDARIMKEINNESDKTDREEDLALYQQLKSAGVNFDNCTLAQMKQMIVTFPPLTSSGAVRKAYDEALYSLPDDQRQQIGVGISEEYRNYMSLVKNGTYKLDSSKSAYSNFMDYVSQKAEANPNLYGKDSSQYVKTLFDNFQTNLQDAGQKF